MCEPMIYFQIFRNCISLVRNAGYKFTPRKTIKAASGFLLLTVFNVWSSYGDLEKLPRNAELVLEPLLVAISGSPPVTERQLHCERFVFAVTQQRNSTCLSTKFFWVVVYALKSHSYHRLQKGLKKFETVFFFGKHHSKNGIPLI